MSPTTRWQNLERIVNAALDVSTTERSGYLKDACGGDEDLRRRAEDLIASFDEAGNFLEQAIGGSVQRSLLAPTPAAGDRIGPYELLEQIGRGGMGTVYRAVRADNQFRQQVAIKFIGSGFVLSQEMVIRFRAERQILAMLSHPNIARLCCERIAFGEFQLAPDFARLGQVWVSRWEDFGDNAKSTSDRHARGRRCEDGRGRRHCDTAQELCTAPLLFEHLRDCRC